MKREVDLTENNDFSSNNNHYFSTKKRVPWRNEWKEYNKSNYIITYTDTFDIIDNISFNDGRSIMIEDIDYDNGVGAVISVSNNGNRTNSTIVDIYDYYDGVSDSYSISSSSLSTNKSRYSITYNTMPTTRQFIGRAKDLRNNHTMINMVNKTKNKYRKKYCSNCNKRVNASPWNKSSYYICEKCKDKGLKENPSRIRKPSSFYEISVPIPCISSDIENVHHNESIRKRPPWRFNLLDQSSWISLKRVKPTHPIGTVYYKNKKLRTREEPWQPNGRVRQEYDDFYDQIEWRNLIANRFKDYL